MKDDDIDMDATIMIKRKEYNNWEIDLNEAPNQVLMVKDHAMWTITDEIKSILQLVKELKNSLSDSYETSITEELISRLHNLVEDSP